MKRKRMRVRFAENLVQIREISPLPHKRRKCFDEFEILEANLEGRGNRSSLESLCSSRAEEMFLTNVLQWKYVWFAEYKTMLTSKFRFVNTTCYLHNFFLASVVNNHKK